MNEYFNKKTTIVFVVGIILGIYLYAYIIESFSWNFILPKKLVQCKKINKIENINIDNNDIFQ